MISKQVGKIKRDTKIIIVSVLALTILTLGVSYSAFFDVQVPETTHSFDTGELKVTIGGSQKIESKQLFPTASAELPNNESFVLSEANANTFATLILKNEGTLDADFAVTISNDTSTGKEGTPIDFTYLNIGIYDESNGKWVDFDSSESGSIYYISISSLTPSSDGVYPILRDIVKANEAKNNTRQYKIYIWLSEDTPTTEIGKLINLKLDVRSTTVDGQIEKNGQTDVSRVES